MSSTESKNNPTPVETTTILKSEYEKARQELVKYLQSGERDFSYKDGVPHVMESKLRMLLLKAGYTEFALAGLGWTGVTDLKKAKLQPQKPETRIKVHIYDKNLYRIPPDQYDAVWLTGILLKVQPSDMVGGKDALRDSVLTQLAAFADLQERARNFFWGTSVYFALSSWRFQFDGSLDFWLNPYSERDQPAGWYSLEDLEKWLSGDPTSPTLKSNQITKPVENDKPRKTYKDYVAEHLEVLNSRLSEAQTNELQLHFSRLLRIALMRCPFEDLRNLYNKDLN